MLRDAGAKEIHMRISCPPTISPCYYGVDTPTREELIASSRSVEEICAYIGADTVGYLSIEGLRAAVGDRNGAEFCDACYTGDYPVPLEPRPQLGLFPRKAPGGDAPGDGTGGTDG
jgi:amidophosphoribosyltransferase